MVLSGERIDKAYAVANPEEGFACESPDGAAASAETDQESNAALRSQVEIK